MIKLFPGIIGKMPTSVERRVIFISLALDILMLEHVLRTIAGRILAGNKSWWRLLLLSVTFALGTASLSTRHGKFLRSGAEQPVWSSLWWLESLIRTAILGTLLGLTEQATVPPQTTLALWGALVLTILISIARLWAHIRGTTMVDLSVKERTVLGAFGLIFLPLCGTALIFHYTEGFPFEEAWNFVNHTGLTVGFGDTRVRSLPGKLVLVTLGNITIGCFSFLLLALREVLPPARTRREIISLTVVLVVYWMLGSLAFALMEGWSFMNGVYFTWASLTTIGFGDFHPTNAASSEFWLIYTYVAVALFGVILSTASEFVHKRHLAQGV